MSQIMFEPTLVLYHAACADGVCAAWAARRRWPEARHEGCAAGAAPRSNVTGHNVLYLDLSPGSGYADELCAKAAAVCVLDHHRTAMWVAGDPRFAGSVLDESRAGCQIAWDYCNPGEGRPWFVDYVADRDLWAWVLPQSEEINTALQAIGCFDDVDAVAALAARGDGPAVRAELLGVGRALVDAKRRTLAAAQDRATPARFTQEGAGHAHVVWLASCAPELISDLGNALLQKALPDGTMPDFTVMFGYHFARDAWSFSLRSCDGRADVEAVARAYGGGGHRNAAGFALPGARFPNLNSPGSPFARIIYDGSNAAARDSEP